MRKAKVIVLGIGLVLVGLAIAAAAGGLYNWATINNPSVHNIWEGSQSDTPDDLDVHRATFFRYHVWVDVEGPYPQVNITSSNGTEVFRPCDNSCLREGDYVEVGSFVVEENDTYRVTIQGSGTIYITQPLGSLGTSLGAALLIGLAVILGALGFPFVIIGFFMKSDRGGVEVVGSPGLPELKR